MEQPIYLLFALIVGLSAGAGVIWLVQRALIIRLTEQLSSSKKDLQKLLVEHDSLTLIQNQLSKEKQDLRIEIAELKKTLELERTQTKELSLIHI